MLADAKGRMAAGCRDEIKVYGFTIAPTISLYSQGPYLSSWSKNVERVYMKMDDEVVNQ